MNQAAIFTLCLMCLTWLVAYLLIQHIDKLK